MRLFPSCLLAIWVTASAAGADKPLAEAAQAVAGRLKGGCIVTGEFRNGARAYGLAGQPPEGVAAPEQVLFEIGSISKMFTGLLLAQAVVEGKVNLETPIKELLGPGITFADPRVGEITLVQLSTHTSGLPRLPDNHAAGVVKGDPYAGYDERLLLRFLTSARLKGEPPFRASYSNLGVGLLGHLLAKRYGKTWEQAVMEKICAPLGLNQTGVQVAALGLPMAPPHAGAESAQNWSFDAMAGAGALRSTAADLVKFGEAMLAPERTALREAFALALRPRAEFGATGGRIGLGIFIRTADGDTAYSHDGGTGGYASMMRVIPAKRLAQAVLINNNSLHGSQVLAAAAPKPSPAATGAPKEIPLPAQALAAFAGVYEVDQDTRFTVLLEEKTGQLWVRLTGQAFLRVFPREPNRFFFKAVVAEIEFHREADKVTALTLFQNGGEMKAVRTAAAPAIKLHRAEELKPYAGNYRLMGLKDIEVTVRENTLYAKLEGQPPAPVFATAADRFEYDVVEAALVFTRDENRRINGLTLLQNGMTLPAPRQEGGPGPSGRPGK